MLAKNQTPGLFNRIAPRYDLANRVLSLGIDRGWRKAVAAHLPDQTGLVVADIAAGTGDLAIALCRERKDLAILTALDPASSMLSLGRAKVEKLGLGDRIRFLESSAENLPFPDQSLDAATIGFGIRNFPDPQAALRELHRVLKPEGRLIILEFSLPPHALVRGAYLAYFRHVLPRLGGWISGDAEAYRYLNQSVEDFPHGQAFCRLLTAAGFGAVRQRPMTWGIAAIYQADRV